MNYTITLTNEQLVGEINKLIEEQTETMLRIEESLKGISNVTTTCKKHIEQIGQTCKDHLTKLKIKLSKANNETDGAAKTIKQESKPWYTEHNGSDSNNPIHNLGGKSRKFKKSKKNGKKGKTMKKVKKGKIQANKSKKARK